MKSKIVTFRLKENELKKLNKVIKGNFKTKSSIIRNALKKQKVL